MRFKFIYETILLLFVLFSVESGNIQLMDYALALGVRHRPDASGRTALMQAARTGNPTMTTYLLDRVRSGTIQNLEIEVTDCRGETALHYAIRSGSTAVVASLIDDGRLMKLDDSLQQRQPQQLKTETSESTSKVSPVDPIELALNDRRLADVCRLLLDRVPKAVGIGRRDRLGRTPLFRFVEHGQLGMLRRYAVGNYSPGPSVIQDRELCFITVCLKALYSVRCSVF
jgi:ankyrin repeat protein